jgi:hypothetical protein
MDTASDTAWETASVTDTVTRRWQEADDAVESLVATLTALAVRAEHRGSRKRPRGRSRPKSTRRYVAEVIRSHRLAPGLRVDRNMIAALFTGHRELVGNPVLVVAVAQACGIIAGRKLPAKDAARLRAASARVARLIQRAQSAGPVPAPAPPPVLETLPAPTAPTQTAPSMQTAPAETSPVVSVPAEVSPTGPTPPPPIVETPAEASRRSYWAMVAVALLLVLIALWVLLLR